MLAKTFSPLHFNKDDFNIDVHNLFTHMYLYVQFKRKKLEFINTS